MRSDLLKTIASAKEVTNAIVLTHNIDFVFLQTVVLSAFRRCGHPALTIFADAACAAESYSNQAPMLSGLGVRYRVVPVAMEPGFRFHPKAVLLSGPDDATLLVGSGNLTFGGWRENAEVWVRFGIGADGTLPFAAFKAYLEEILGRVPLPDAVTSEIEDAFDPKTKVWAATGLNERAGLLGRVGSGDTILEQMTAVIEGTQVEQLVVCAPYFDTEGEALARLIRETGARRVSVLYQPSGSTLTMRAWESVRESAELSPTDFQHARDTEKSRPAFVHAKFYAFLSSEEALILSGSANCSRAALTVPGRRGNAELMAIQRLSRSDFESEYLEELTIGPGQAEIQEKTSAIEEDDRDAHPNLRVLAARFETGSLFVGYSPSSVKLTECRVDGALVRHDLIERGVVRASCFGEPRSVILIGEIDGERIESLPGWVDQEYHLRSTARGRGLADIFRRRFQPGEWSAGAWSEVLDVFCKHLTYLPSSGVGLESITSDKDHEQDKPPEFTAEDVFAPDYHPPSLGKYWYPVVESADGRVRSLQQLLLKWFGYSNASEQEEEGAQLDPGSVDDEDDDVVDRPMNLLKTTPIVEEPPAASDRDRRRIQKLLTRVRDAMTNPDFLQGRRPELLAGDLKVAAVLLRTGLREGWIDESEFFEVTHYIWSALFFTSEPQTDVGWIEYRTHESEDPATFIDALRSPDLSAALIGWTIAIPMDVRTPEHARFALANALSVARLPWLWQGGDQEEIARNLGLLISHTAKADVNRDEYLEGASLAWHDLLRCGAALRRFEEAISGFTPDDLRAHIRQSRLERGELLWQGTAGFCVVTEACPRFEGQNVPVLVLQGTGTERKFKALYTIPIRTLLDQDIIPISEKFGKEPRKELTKLLKDVTLGFGKTGV